MFEEHLKKLFFNAKKRLMTRKIVNPEIINTSFVLVDFFTTISTFFIFRLSELLNNVLYLKYV
jgi:hypothetical protein